MRAARTLQFITVEDYLAGELRSREKHEYSAGRVYAMAGASNAHNRLASNALGLLHARLRGRDCEAFNSDTKVRIRLPTHTRFYYPDAMVVCDSNASGESFQDRPVVIAEVLSPATRRIDEGEKRDAYLSIPTLKAYLLVETTLPRVLAYERTPDGGFAERVYEGPDATIPLPHIGVTLPLRDLYERIDFAAAIAEETPPSDE